MSLSDLPKEIILGIANFLDDAETNALLRTNSEVYHLLNYYLYRRDLTKPKPKESISLIWAIKNENEAIVERVLAAGRDLGTIPESYQTALQLAAGQGCVHLVKRLLQVDGINPNFGGRSQSPPLVLAAENGHSATVELLLAMDNIDPNVCEGPQSGSPLLFACRMGHVSVVKQLLARDDVDLNACGFYGYLTPLIAACHRHDAEMVDLLIAKDGTDVNLQDIHGNTPLIIAVQQILPSMQRHVESLLRDDLDTNNI
jgi:ankyrin repeat protein